MAPPRKKQPKIVQIPRTRRDWMVAIVGGLSGFFFGGAAIAVLERVMRKLGL